MNWQIGLSDKRRLGGPTESEHLDLYTDEEDAMLSIVGASISYRLAFGPNAGLGAPEERH